MLRFKLAVMLRRLWGKSFGADPNEVLQRHAWAPGEANIMLERIQDLPEYGDHEFEDFELT